MKILIMILIVCALLMGVDGFKNITFPGVTIDTCEAEVIYGSKGRTWVTDGNSAYGSDGSTYSIY